MKEVLRKLSIDIENSDDVFKILGEPKEYPTELIEELSLETATLYFNGDISFLEGDFIMNNLYGFWSHFFFENFTFSKIAWECYVAFDSGEYYRTEDDSEIDPENVYTKPMIEKFLKKYNKI